MSTETQSQTFQSPLGQAVAIWSTGKPIPLTLAATLIEEGYDVASLERHHRFPAIRPTHKFK